MRSYRSILISLWLILCISPMSAQDVVISEYLNDVAPSIEWTEILVVKDNMDLRGYIVTDNRGQGDQRQSGPPVS